MIEYTCRECGDLFYSDSKQKRVFCDKYCSQTRVRRALEAYKVVYNEDKTYPKKVDRAEITDSL